MEYIVLFLLCFLQTIIHTSTGGTMFYSDNGLGQTVMVKHPWKKKKEIKQEILALLGLHRRPRPLGPTNENSAPRYMMNLYRTLETEAANDNDQIILHHKLKHFNLTMVGMENSLGSANLIMSFVNKVKDGHRMRHERNRQFFFDFSNVPAREQLTGAEMRIYKRPVSWYTGSDNETFTLQIYRVIQEHGYSTKQLVLESRTSILAGQSGWVDLNMTNAATQWTNFPLSNHGIYLRIADRFGHELNPNQVGMIDSKGPANRHPFMVAFFNTNKQLHVRQTRSARKNNRKNSKNERGYQATETYKWGQSIAKAERRACQRKDLYVRFGDLGWADWIIAPEGYAAYYCNGQCNFPLNANMNATNHAIVQTLVHLMNKRVPKACCAPTKLAAISVLYFDASSNVILKKYRNMVVRACGCH